MLGEALFDGRSPPPPIRCTENVNTSTEVSASLEEESHNTMDFRKMIAFAGAAYFVVMTAIVVPVACVSTVVLLFPLIYLNLPLFNYLENHLCKLVNNHWVSASVYCGLNIVEYGCDIRAYAEKRCLFLANHLGLIDHFVLMQSLHNKGRVPGNWMWVIYNIWKYTPLGVMWSAHGNFFINGGKARKVALLSSFKKHLSNTFYKFDYRWIVMYPEGSRLFLIKESCARFAEKIGLPALRHCVYPRTGAAHAVLDVLGPATSAQKPGAELDVATSRCGAGPAVEYIIDATLGYPKGAVPNIGSAIVGEWPSSDGRVCVHYDVYKVDPEWANETNLQAFLYKRYQAKDELLQQFYTTNTFPGEARPVVVSQLMMLLTEWIWIFLYYTHYTIWIRPLFSYIASLAKGYFL